MFSKQWLSQLQWLLLTLLPFCVYGGECNGTRLSERIKETQPKYVHVLPGNQVVINWTWCIAENSTVTGIVIYRVSWPKSRNRPKHVLSMDLSKTVYYLKDNLKHELRSIVNKTSFEEKTIFIINNVSTTDGGTYSLHVRREGHRDLHSEVQVIVMSAEHYKEGLLTTPLTEATNLNFFWARNHTSQSKKSDQRNVESEHFSHLVLVIILPLLFGVIFIVIAVLLMRRMICKMHATHDGSEHGEGNVLISRSVCCESSQGNFNGGMSTTSDRTALAKEENVLSTCSVNNSKDGVKPVEAASTCCD